MKKMFFLYILSLFVIQSNCKLIEVIADFDSNLNLLIYNGKVFKMTDDYNYFSSQNDTAPSEPEKSESFFDGFWFNFIGFSILACFAGAMSGLTVGYLSIDMLILEIKLNNGTEKEKIYAKKIRKIISDHHWILVTLLVCNAFACEAMPILLDKLVNEMMAIVVSVTVLLFVGEIVPQALCTGPNQMKIAAFLAPFTYCLMIITFPISYPIARFMDLVIGKHGKTRFCNSDLKSVIELHLKEANEDITSQQIGYFTGFLDIINTKIKEIMLPLEKVFKLDYNFNLNHNNLNEIIEKDYSRIPIYETTPDNLIGVLLLKDLIGKDLSHPIPLNELNINLLNAIYVNENTFFIDLFEKFKNGKSKMAFVYREVTKEEKLLPDDLSTVNNDNESKEDEKIEVKDSLIINNNEVKDKNKDEKPSKQDKIIEDKEENIKAKEPLISINDEDEEDEKNNNENKNKKEIKEEIIDIEDTNKNVKDSESENKKRVIIGILTLEDLIESLLKIHFQDERDFIRKSTRKLTL